jgi:hypothetical protein
MKQAPKSLAGLLTLLLALMVSVAMARTTVPQDDQAGQTQSSDQATQGQTGTQHHAKAHRMTVTGCLEKTADGNGFQITSDKNQKTYTLNPASGMDLSAHVGHTVRVTGTRAAAAAGQPAGAAGMEQLDVKSVKHIRSTCKQKSTK